MRRKLKLKLGVQTIRMENKIYLTFGILILSLGAISAAGVIDNFTLDYSTDNIHAGKGGELGFSFDFNDLEMNSPDSSLVLRLNITSEDSEYPVWKNDFTVNGFVAEESLFRLGNFPFWTNEYSLKCVNDYFSPKTERGTLYNEEIIENGTFYCYDPNDYLNFLKLGRRDMGALEFTPKQNIYPGDYNFSLELMEVEKDFEPPFVEFITENEYYNENEAIAIKFNVTDLYNIHEVKYKISNNLIDKYYNSGWIEADYNSESKLYEDSFDIDEHELNVSGSYYIWAWACDMLGNCRKM